jgi:putative tryptophan/tyrosine transport system substrate-binding protein
LARGPNSSLILPPDASTIAHRDLIVALAAQHRLPAVYALKTFVVAGGLMSYGTDQNDLFRLTAAYVDRILRGDKPADLPVQAPTRFETTVNLKTAKALGLDVPAHLLVAADEVRSFARAQNVRFWHKADVQGLASAPSRLVVCGSRSKDDGRPRSKPL